MRFRLISADVSVERGAAAPIGRYSHLSYPIPSPPPSPGAPVDDVLEDEDASLLTTSDGGGDAYAFPLWVWGLGECCYGARSASNSLEFFFLIMS